MNNFKAEPKARPSINALSVRVFISYVSAFVCQIVETAYNDSSISHKVLNSLRFSVYLRGFMTVQRSDNYHY